MLRKLSDTQRQQRQENPPHSHIQMKTNGGDNDNDDGPDAGNTSKTTQHHESAVSLADTRVDGSVGKKMVNNGAAQQVTAEEQTKHGRKNEQRHKADTSDK